MHLDRASVTLPWLKPSIRRSVGKLQVLHATIQVSSCHQLLVGQAGLTLVQRKGPQTSCCIISILVLLGPNSPCMYCSFTRVLRLQQLKDSPCTSECLSPSEASGREEATGRPSSESVTTKEGTEQVSSQADSLHEGMAGLLALSSTSDSKAVAQVWPVSLWTLGALLLH